MHRRTVLKATAATPLLATPLLAQEGFPNRNVVIVSGYAAGGMTDLTTRAIAERMQRDLGQSVVVDVKTGGATAIASTYVAQARPDGYTLLMGATSLAINPALQPSLTPQEPMRELTPIGMGYRSPFVLHVHPSLPARTLAEFVAYAKANPGKINFGSSGTGAVNHLCIALLAKAAGIEMVHIPYRGGAPALLDLREGRIDAMFQAAFETLPVLREGVTHAIAVSSAQRLSLLPDVPAIAETYPGFDAVYWQGLFGPAGLPAPVVRRLGAAVRVATDDPELRARLADQGVMLQTGDDAYLRDLLASETRSWGDIIREGNIRAD